jgi:lipoate-protein ligase B
MADEEAGVDIDPTELMEWETPTLVSEDIDRVTRGGKLTFKSPGDDVWYQS